MVLAHSATLGGHVHVGAGANLGMGGACTAVILACTPLIVRAYDEPRLTPRETEVLRLVAKGLSARAIAARLTLSHRTVENHVQNSLRKLQLSNRVELARYAIEKGLDDD